MIGSFINRDMDTYVIINDEEARKLESNVLEGIIFNFIRPHEQKALFLSIDHERDPAKARTFGGIGDERQEDSYSVYLDGESYQKLLKRGSFGNRVGFFKVDVMVDSYVMARGDCFAEDYYRSCKWIKHKYENLEHYSELSRKEELEETMKEAKTTGQTKLF